MAITKKDVNHIIAMIQELYLEDNIPWICGYSGGKDSSAVVQLVWNALAALPPGQLTPIRNCGRISALRRSGSWTAA